MTNVEKKVGLYYLMLASPICSPDYIINYVDSIQDPDFDHGRSLWRPSIIGFSSKCVWVFVASWLLEKCSSEDCCAGRRSWHDVCSILWLALFLNDNLYVANVSSMSSCLIDSVQEAFKVHESNLLPSSRGVVAYPRVCLPKRVGA